METVENLEKSDSNPVAFHSQDTGHKKYLCKCIADKTLVLKVGAPVILLYNINSVLVNGLTGVVIDFQDNFPVVDFPQVDIKHKFFRKTWTFYDEKNQRAVIASRTQIPLKVSWAITAHKSQGQTWPAAHVVSGNEFVQGQLYVACSRVTSKEGLKLSGFNVEKLIPPS